MATRLYAPRRHCYLRREDYSFRLRFAVISAVATIVDRRGFKRHIAEGRLHA